MLNTQALLTSEKATQLAPARGVAFRSSALLIALVPLDGIIVLIVFLCGDSQPGENRYGANPKGA